MIGKRPAYMNSPYFVNEPGNWYLKPGAPADVIKAFNADVEALKQMDNPPEVKK